MTHLPKIARIAASKYWHVLRWEGLLALNNSPVGTCETHARTGIYLSKQTFQTGILCLYLHTFFTNFKNVELSMATCFHFMISELDSPFCFV